MFHLMVCPCTFSKFLILNQGPRIFILHWVLKIMWLILVLKLKETVVALEFLFRGCFSVKGWLEVRAGLVLKLYLDNNNDGAEDITVLQCLFCARHHPKCLI